MRYETLYLTEYFPQLKGNDCNPKLEIYLSEAMVDMGWGDKKQPCILICPGGGYGGVRRREAEPIALLQPPCCGTQRQTRQFRWKTAFSMQ